MGQSGEVYPLSVCPNLLGSQLSHAILRPEDDSSGPTMATSRKVSRSPRTALGIELTASTPCQKVPQRPEHTYASCMEFIQRFIQEREFSKKVATETETHVRRSSACV